MVVIGKACCKVLLFLMSLYFFFWQLIVRALLVSFFRLQESISQCHKILLFPRDAAWGTILYQSVPVPVPIDSTAGVKCDTSESQGFYNRVASRTTFDIATIDNSSIGYRIRVEPRFRSDILQFFDRGEPTPVGEFRLQDYKFRLELYWLGPVVSGPAIEQGLLAEYFYSGAETIRFFVDNPVTISKATCAAQNVSVSMGSQKASGFSGGKNSLTPVPFAINLDCEPGA